MRGIFFALVIALLGLALPARAVEPVSTPPGTALATKFSLPDLAGNPHTLEEYRAQGPVMLVFYATWCVTCLREIPVLKQTYKEYRDRNLQMVGVNVGMMDTLENAKTYALKHRLPYPVLYDQDALVAKSYGVKSFPRIFLIDEDGSIIAETVHVPDKQLSEFLN